MNTRPEPLNQHAREELIGKEFKFLDSGVIILDDVMGDDRDVVNAARVSYGAQSESVFSDVYYEAAKRLNDKQAELMDEEYRHLEGIIEEESNRFNKSIKKDEMLIRYLMSNRHTTPFEMCELKFVVEVPMDCWRQWIRHRTANVNEYSTRYTEAIDRCQRTDPEKWRSQAKNNKQGSGDYLTEWPEFDADGNRVHLSDITGNIAGQKSEDGSGYESVGHYLSAQERELQLIARDVYEDRLKAGVAKEQARKDLPLSTYTKAVWKMDLHNLLHFLGLRMDGHAQSEIREAACQIGEIVKHLFPITWNAFEDYRLNSVYLSALDKAVIADLVARLSDGVKPPMIEGELDESMFPERMTKRERNVCVNKLKMLGLIDG